MNVVNQYGEKRNGFTEVVAFCHVTCRYFDRFLLQGVDGNWRQACFSYLAPGLICEGYWQVNSRRSIFRIADPNNHFDLSAQEFRDALAIRYRKPLLNLPPKCDGCGAPSSLDHFLICRRGGFVVQRHNEIRDAIGDLAALAWGQVRQETVVIEAEDQQSETLIADLCVREVWLPQAEALFDIRVVDTDAQSYLHHTPSRVLLNAEVEKKNKYAEACAARHAHFIPLCFFVDGLAGSEANCFLKRMACRLSSRWDRSYAEVLGWIRARLAFAIVQASVLCVRGSHTKWRSLGLEDGAAIDLN